MIFRVFPSKSPTVVLIWAMATRNRDVIWRPLAAGGFIRRPPAPRSDCYHIL